MEGFKTALPPPQENKQEQQTEIHASTKGSWADCEPARERTRRMASGDPLKNGIVVSAEGDFRRDGCQRHDRAVNVSEPLMSPTWVPCKRETETVPAFSSASLSHGKGRLAYSLLEPLGGAELHGPPSGKTAKALQPLPCGGFPTRKIGSTGRG